ncbi:MAG TPA: hypothetical protein VGW39_00735 [Chthoniobacterales bacterium]|nr:hypothetical protein [Chthoniobacterales bacterium]
MFPLKTTALPSSAAALERLLNESLRRVFDVEIDPVTIRDDAYPNLAEINIALDRARLRPDPPRPQLISGKTSPAFQVGQLAVRGSALSIGPATVDLALSARAVRLGQGKDSNDEIVLSLHDAAEGKIEISTSLADLEEVIAEIAKSEAGKHGVTIGDVQLAARATSPRSLEVAVRLRAKKLFLSASIQIAGQLDLDSELNAKISGLKCKGDGAIAAIACGVLDPHLQRLDGREFSLMSLPLGEIRLRDVRLGVSDKLSVTAEFGSAT